MRTQAVAVQLQCVRSEKVFCKILTGSDSCVTTWISAACAVVRASTSATTASPRRVVVKNSKSMNSCQSIEQSTSQREYEPYRTLLHHKDLKPKICTL